MINNSVLCAIDANDYDQQVIDLAATFARHFGTKLDLVHVTLAPDPGKLKWPALVGAPSELIRDNRRLQRIGSNVEGVDVRRHHLSGFPVEQIVDFVQQNQPKLLVLGTHARKGIRRLFGSIASQIMRRVSCPVLIYRQTQKSQTSDPGHAISHS